MQKASINQFWAGTRNTVKPAFALPCKNASGFSVLLSAAAAYQNTADLKSVNLVEFESWMRPVIDAVPDFSRLGDPASVISNSGTAVADFALLPESMWLSNAVADRQPTLTFHYPSYKLDLAMPLAVWDGPETGTDKRNAIMEFANFLIQPQAQEDAWSFGLRTSRFPLSASNPPQIFSNAIRYNITLGTPAGTPIMAPDVSLAGQLLGWFKSFKSC
jgi:hypothetical protein